MAAALLALALALAIGTGVSAGAAAAREADDRHADSGGENAVAYLGLLLGGPVSTDQVLGLGLSRTELGRVVTGLDAGSPAESAHIRAGDLILGVDGVRVRSAHDLDAILWQRPPGTSLRLLIRRGEETREVPVVVGELPPASLGFGVVPLADRDSARAQLPASLVAGDSLPVVDWVADGIWPARRGDFRPGVVIASLNGSAVRSPGELRERARALHPGDDLFVGFYSRGRLRRLDYLAQAPVPAWSGLRLEEITPTLIESESLSTADGAPTGLFVRRVEPRSVAEQAMLRPGDRILGAQAEPWTAGGWADGARVQPVSSVEQFDSIYAAIPEGALVHLAVAREGVGVEGIRLERGFRMGTPRYKPWLGGYVTAFDLAPNPRTPDVLAGDLFRSPYLQWSKVTGPRLGGLTSLCWDGARHSGRSVVQPGDGSGDDATLRTYWTWDYGIGDKRWHHDVRLRGNAAWLPWVAYQDVPAPFYREEISSPVEALLSSAFVGEDKLRYVHSRGWSAGWAITAPRLPGHRVQLDFQRIRQSPLANVPTSSLFGRSRFTPNPTGSVTSGLLNGARLRYEYSNTRWRTWSRTFLEGEVQAAGGALGGDLDFVRWEANAGRSFRLVRHLYLDNRVRAGLATGRLPLQLEFYAGGKGTLPGYADFRFAGDRTLLGQTRLSVVPFGLPEQAVQFRLFAGLDAGNAWRSDRISGVPRLRSDLALGAGIFGGRGDEVFFPSGVALAWARPLDEGIGRWRLQFDFVGGARR